MGIYWERVEERRMIQELQERCSDGQSAAFLVVQEDPQNTQVPAGSIEEVKIVLAPICRGQ